jgi:hypothetical protein
VTRRFSNPVTDQYSHGTLGVHIWELTGNQVNFSLNVSEAHTNPSFAVC